MKTIKDSDGRSTLSVKAGNEWGKRLGDAHLLPQSCYDIKIDLPCDGVGQITFFCHLTDDVAAALGDACPVNAKEANQCE